MLAGYQSTPSQHTCELAYLSFKQRAFLQGNSAPCNHYNWFISLALSQRNSIKWTSTRRRGCSRLGCQARLNPVPFYELIVSSYVRILHYFLDHWNGRHCGQNFGVSSCFCACAGQKYELADDRVGCLRLTQLLWVPFAVCVDLSLPSYLRNHA